MKQYLGWIISAIVFVTGVVLIFGVYKEKVDTAEIEIEKL